MNGYVADIGKITLDNTNFRTVLYTAKNCQLVVMHLKPGEDIGEEVHQLDQFIRIEAGTGQAILDGATHAIAAEYAIIIPAGTKHNIINTSTAEPMKLYTLYAPPEHRYDIVHVTKADAVADTSDHFDGTTTE